MRTNVDEMFKKSQKNTAELMFEVALAALGILISWAIIYLLGAFIAVSFDISDWSEMGRTLAAIAAASIAFLGIALLAGVS